MDQYQAFEAIYTMRGIAAQDGIEFFTVLSAYLVVAYIAEANYQYFKSGRSQYFIRYSVWGRSWRWIYQSLIFTLCP